MEEYQAVEFQKRLNEVGISSHILSHFTPSGRTTGIRTSAIITDYDLSVETTIKKQRFGRDEYAYY